jgi:DNA-binding SARP family transcriptional activator
VDPPAPATSSPKAAIALAEPGTGVSTLVHVQCFGRLRVTSEGRELTPESAAGPRYKAWEILAYVACQPNGQVPKEKLMEALWPEKSAHDADDSVRVNLAALRDILAEQVPGISRDVIWTKNGVCRLDLSVVSTDVSQFCQLCERLPGMSINEAAQAFQELEGLYRGDLVTEPLYDWVDGHMEGASLRQEYRETFRRTTFGLAKRFQQTGQPALAIPLYERPLQSEPALEDVVRELYRCHHQLGNAGAIVRIDKDLRRVLKQTYGEHADRSLLNPEPQTDQLFQQLLADLRSAGTQRGQAVA